MALTTAELQTLDRLTQQALDLPAAARANWIDALVPPESAFAPLLRSTLLAEVAEDGVATADFLGSLPAYPDRALAGAGGDPARDDLVGPYRLVRTLGEGGMSSVWLAVRADGTHRREVALKLPHRHLLDRGLAARMLRERDILAALNDDHIARLYEAGVDGAGRPYLALEYVQGVPINTYCLDQKVRLDDRVRLMAQVARAVAHAHANLVVHRDLKPNNILVTTGDTVARVKLLDFGIAKLLAKDDQHSPAADLTQMLGRALTPDYASPEQLLEQPVTTASDIYSLGVVLYEVIAGEKPYKLKRQTAAGLADAVLHADIARPSRRCAQGKNAADARRIEGDLDAIVLKAMKPAAAERYATASALADDLERFLAHHPVLAQPDSLAYRARRFVRRHALAVSAGAAISIALIAGAAVAIWQAQQARLETAKTRAVRDFLQSIISVGSVDRQDALLRRKQPIGDVLLDAAKSLPGRFADQPEVRAELQGMLGTALGDLSMHESARAIQETRLAELNARDAPLAERMQAQVELATTLADTGERTRSNQLLQGAVDALAGRGDAAARRVLAQALRASSLAKVFRYDGTSGVEDAERAVAISAQVEPGSKNHVSGESLLGFAHANNRNLAAAEQAFERAIELAHQLPPSERAFEADVRRRYGEALIPARLHGRALAQFQEALKVIEQTSGRDTFRWARTAVVAANLTAAAGDAPRAIELFGQALRVYDRFGSELDPLFVSAANAMFGSALAENGQFADAVRHARASHEPYRQATGNQQFNSVWLAATRYANVLHATGDYAQAEKLLVQALATARAVGISRANSDMTSGERLLALTLMARGRHAEAQAMLKEIIEVDGAPAGRFINQRNFSRLALARSYLDQGRLDDAQAEITILRGIIEGVAADEIAFSRPAAAQLASLQGTLSLKRGDANAAAEQYQRAIDILTPRQHPQSPHLANARADLALALAGRGDATGARALATQARAAFAQHPAVAPHLRQSLAAVEMLLARR